MEGTDPRIKLYSESVSANDRTDDPLATNLDRLRRMIRHRMGAGPIADRRVFTSPQQDSLQSIGTARPTSNELPGLLARLRRLLGLR